MVLVTVSLICKFEKSRQPRRSITCPEITPEPANIARHRCVKTKKQNTIEEELVTAKKVLLHDRDTFFRLVSLILQRNLF